MKPKHQNNSWSTDEEITFIVKLPKGARDEYIKLMPLKRYDKNVDESEIKKFLNKNYLTKPSA